MTQFLKSSARRATPFVYGLITILTLWLGGTAQAQTMLFDSSVSSKSPAKLSRSIVNNDPAAFRATLSDSELKDETYLIRYLDKTVRVSRATALRQQAAQNDLGGLIPFAFQDARGSLVFDTVDGKITGARLHDVDNRQVFEATIEANGQLAFHAKDLNRHICVDLIKPQFTQSAGSPDIALTPNLISDNPSTLTLGQMQSLESLPGSDKVLFIDYWGGVVSGKAWNFDFNGGADIPYDPFDTSGNVNDFTPGELAVMYTGWADVAEDYAPFDINVTTNETIFNNTLDENRARLIVTPTIAWFDPSGQTGGVAYVGVFGSTDDYYSVGWSWSDSFLSIGHTNSHEAGHNMGLIHDGFDNGNPSDGNLSLSEQYYQGHGNWAPIMGGSFLKSYVQWSQGEYTGAQQYVFNRVTRVYDPIPGQQNDLAILNSVLGQVSDSVGDTEPTAKPLDISGDEFVGLIRPAGLSSDVDLFRIGQRGTSDVSITVRPLFEGLGFGTGSNLSMKVTLTRDDGSLVAMENPSGDPSTNKLEFNAELTPDDYFLRIENMSFDTSANSGFSEYANGGLYEVTVSGGFLAAEPDLIPLNESITPGTVGAGSSDNVTLSAAVTNVGFQTATNYTVTFYQSTDETISTADTPLAPSQASTGSLATSDTSPSYQHVLSSIPQEPGTYYYGMCVSASNPAEVNTANNCSTALRLVVGDDFCFPLVAGVGNVALICL